MGQRGPPPKPTAIRLLEGNRGRLKINEREPKPRLGAPACPRWIDAEARAEWRRIVPELVAIGVLARIDRADLIGYCTTWSRWRSTYLSILDLGTTFTTPQGFIQTRPEVIQEAKLLALLRLYAADFGMTPASRSKVTTSKEPQDAFDALFGG